MCTCLQSQETLDALTKENEQLKKSVDSLTKENDHLKEQCEWFRRAMFGRKTERVVDLPDSAEAPYLPGFESLESKEPIETEEVAAHTRKKRKPKNDNSNGLTIPEGLPVKQIIIDLPDEEKTDLTTGEKMVRIGQEVTRQLAYIPGRYYVKEIIRPKYALPSQEEAGVFSAEPQSTILPKSRADESLLAEIVVRKFCDHLPLYRME